MVDFMDKVVAGNMTLREWQDFSRTDNCLDKMVPSDLRLLVNALIKCHTPEPAAEDTDPMKVEPTFTALRKLFPESGWNGEQFVTAAFAVVAEKRSNLADADDLAAHVLSFHAMAILHANGTEPDATILDVVELARDNVEARREPNDDQRPYWLKAVKPAGNG